MLGAAVLAACAGGATAPAGGERPGSAAAVEPADSVDTVDAVDAVDAVGDEPTSGPSSTGGPAPVQPDGFDSVTARVTAADGTVCEVCVWLADTVDTRSRGLMGVTDLGGRAGMAFAYAEPVSQQFYMYSTPTPLSIAWFAADGALVSATEMAPCMVDDPGECPLYGASAPYVLAIEAFRGGLEELGIGPGASAVLLSETRGADCAAGTVPAGRDTPSS